MQNNVTLETPRTFIKLQCAKYCEQWIWDTIFSQHFSMRIINIKTNCVEK